MKVSGLFEPSEPDLRCTRKAPFRENTLLSFDTMQRGSIDPGPPTPEHVRTLKTLGNGRAATARLVDATFADGSRVRCVEKVFAPGWLTRFLYRLFFAAPFAYQTNRDAIWTSFYRRRVAAAMLRNLSMPVGVAEPIYVRFDGTMKAWVLACHHIEGRGPLPASHAAADDLVVDRSVATTEMSQLISLMCQLEHQLILFGLYGSGWQVSPRAMVSTANLLIRRSKPTTQGRIDTPRYTIIDLESGIPSVLIPRYLGLAWKRGSFFPFDDLDPSRLRSEVLRLDERMRGEGREREADQLRHDTDNLIAHSHRWKQAEAAPFRQPWHWFRGERRSFYRHCTLERWNQQRLVDGQTSQQLSQSLAGFWLFWLIGCLALLPGGSWLVSVVGNRSVRKAAKQFATQRRCRHVIMRRYRRRQTREWIAAGRVGECCADVEQRFLSHRFMAFSLPRTFHRWLSDSAYRRRTSKQARALLSSSRSQTAFGLKLFNRTVRSWRSRDWLTQQQATELRKSFHGQQSSVYARGFASHLLIKMLSPVMTPLKFGGTAFSLAGASWWYAILPFLFMPALRTVVTANSWARSRQARLPHGIALLTGAIPTVGSLAFVLQMSVVNRNVSKFLLCDAACQVGRWLPVYGGRDSRTEHLGFTAIDWFVAKANWSATNRNQKLGWRMNRFWQTAYAQSGGLFLRWLGGLIAVATVFTSVLMVSAQTGLASESLQATLIQEGGVIESISAWLYLVVALGLMAVGVIQHVKRNFASRSGWVSHPWLLAIVTGTFLARELDFHSRFTGGSVIKTSFYLSSEVPRLHQAIALTTLTVIAIVILRVATLYRNALVDRLYRGQFLGVLPLVAMGLVVASKGIDAGLGTLRRNDWKISDSMQRFAGNMEEITELFIPCLFLAMLAMAVWRSTSVAKESTDEDLLILKFPDPDGRSEADGWSNAA